MHDYLKAKAMALRKLDMHVQHTARQLHENDDHEGTKLYV